MSRRERTPDFDTALDTLLRILPVASVEPWPDEPAQTAVEPRTDGAWRWVVAGIRWRSCGCASAGLTHREDTT